MLPVKESIGGNPPADVPALELNKIQATGGSSAAHDAVIQIDD